MISLPKLSLYLAAAQTVFALECLAGDPVPSDVADAHDAVEVPESVLRAFRVSYPDLEITGTDQEVAGGKTYYEIETGRDGVEMDFVYLGDGTLVQTEEEIGEEALPESVVKSVREAHPGCDIHEVEKITRAAAIQYDVVVECADLEIEMFVAADGSILASHQVTEEEEAGDDAGQRADDDEDDEDDEDDDRGEG